MKKIKPIPKRLLPHSAKYQEYLGNNGEGDEWGEEACLSFIKIEEKKQIKVTSNGREVVGNAKMFYDCMNSNGLLKEPEQNSKIIYGNKTYLVVDTDVLCPDSETPHHYEILLK